MHSVGKKFKLVNAGHRALESLALEKGYFHWHADIRTDDTPLEAGLQSICKLKTSVLFLGRKALERQQEETTRKKVVTFTLNDPSVCILGNEGILRNGEIVGYVRRGEYAFYLGTSIGRGYVKMPEDYVAKEEFWNTGKWEIEVMGKKYPISLHSAPPFDSQNLRLKGFYDNNNG